MKNEEQRLPKRENEEGVEDTITRYKILLPMHVCTDICINKAHSTAAKTADLVHSGVKIVQKWLILDVHLLHPNG